MKKVLLCGQYSFAGHAATAGDFMVLDVVCRWLERCRIDFDVALGTPYVNGVDWRSVKPNEYSHVMFICGPFGPSPTFYAFMDFFSACYAVGLNLSMVQPGKFWNPFDLLLERDSSTTIRPDLALLCEQEKVPVVGVCLIHPQPEYGKHGLQKQSNDSLCRLLDSREMAVVDIDTCLDPNRTKLRSPREVESLIARMDVVVTTRLHGMVLALKNGVPVVAVDSVSGGAKVLAQARVLGWSQAFAIDSLTDEDLRRSFAYCLTEAARREARDCRDRAIQDLCKVRDEVIASIDDRPVQRVAADKRVGRPEDSATNPFLSVPAYLLRKMKGLGRRIMRQTGMFLVRQTDDRGFRLTNRQPDPKLWRAAFADHRRDPTMT